MKRIRVFWDLEKEEQWLNEMNDNGYEFIRRTGFSYEFRLAEEKSKFRYCIDVKKRKDKEFDEFIESLDIKLIYKNLILNYYQIPKDSGIQKLYTDSRNMVSLYLRYILCLLFLGVVNILILYDAQGPYVFNISIPFVINSIILCVVVYAIIQYIKNIILLYRK